MIPQSCLTPYLIDWERPAMPPTHISTSAPFEPGAFALENVFCFAPPLSVGRFDLLAQTLQIIDMGAGRLKIKPLCEVDYALPKQFGTVPRLGVRVNALVNPLIAELQTQGWPYPIWRLADMDALEITATFRLHPTDSMHDWLEHIKGARPLFDGLAGAGFDVRPDLEVFLRHAR